MPWFVKQQQGYVILARFLSTYPDNPSIDIDNVLIPTLQAARRPVARCMMSFMYTHPYIEQRPTALGDCRLFTHHDILTGDFTHLVLPL